jgi:hypothetical protein
MTDRPGLDFSFSGLKTQVLLAWQASDKSEQTRADVARAFEEAIVETLAIKCRRALAQTGARRLVVAGGAHAAYFRRGGASVAQCLHVVDGRGVPWRIDRAATEGSEKYQRWSKQLASHEASVQRINMSPAITSGILVVCQQIRCPSWQLPNDRRAAHGPRFHRRPAHRNRHRHL